ncbi:MAG: lysophospholipase [Ruminococcus sp.]|nr:lysophospholipase [Ruminococcus sp.]
MLNAESRKDEFISECDGLKISTLTAVPNGEIKGILQIVHGMCEYKERYTHFMDYMAGRGFITVIHDNRGHGKSILNDDDLGFFYEGGGIGYVEDIAQLNKIIKSEFSNLPYFLLGHSMGSLGVRAFIKKYDSLINGLFVCGSPCFDKFSNIGMAIESAIAHKLGEHYRSEKIASIMEANFNKNFGDIPHSWICSDSEIIDKYNADPLCNFTFTLNGYEALLYLISETYSENGWNILNPAMPIRFISGMDDPCMVSEKKFYNAIELLKTVGYINVSGDLFSDMRHEILNEKNNIIVYNYIAENLLSWIDKK